MDLVGHRACWSPALLDNAQPFYKMYQSEPLIINDWEFMVLLLLSRILWILFLFSESLNMLILPLRVFSFPILLFILLTLLLLLSHFSRVRLCATPEMAAHQASPSLEFSRQEHWSGLPFPSPMQESEKWVAQSCLTLSDPIDCSLPGSSVHGIFQTRVLEWGAIAFSVLTLGSH